MNAPIKISHLNSHSPNFSFRGPMDPMELEPLTITEFLRTKLPQKIVNKMRFIFARELIARKEQRGEVIERVTFMGKLKVAYFKYDEPLMEEIFLDMAPAIETSTDSAIAEAIQLLDDYGYNTAVLEPPIDEDAAADE